VHKLGSFLGSQLDDTFTLLAQSPTSANIRKQVRQKQNAAHTIINYLEKPTKNVPADRIHVKFKTHPSPWSMKICDKKGKK